MNFKVDMDESLEGTMKTIQEIKEGITTQEMQVVMDNETPLFNQVAGEGNTVVYCEYKGENTVGASVFVNLEVTWDEQIGEPKFFLVAYSEYDGCVEELEQYADTKDGVTLMRKDLVSFLEQEQKDFERMDKEMQKRG